MSQTLTPTSSFQLAGFALVEPQTTMNAITTIFNIVKILFIKLDSFTPITIKTVQNKTNENIFTLELF
jgi:hypothetical protein